MAERHAPCAGVDGRGVDQADAVANERHAAVIRVRDRSGALVRDRVAGRAGPFRSGDADGSAAGCDCATIQQHTRVRVTADSSSARTFDRHGSRSTRRDDARSARLMNEDTQRATAGTTKSLSENIATVGSDCSRRLQHQTVVGPTCSNTTGASDGHSAARSCGNFASRDKDSVIFVGATAATTGALHHDVATA